MNWNPGYKLAVAALVPVLLIACHKATTPTPFPELKVVSLEHSEVTLKLGNDTDHWVPKDAFLLRAGTPGVFVAREGRARFQMVKPGQQRDKYIQILSGLSGTETVLIGDLQKVHDGSPLAPEKSTEK